MNATAGMGRIHKMNLAVVTFKDKDGVWRQQHVFTNEPTDEGHEYLQPCDQSHEAQEDLSESSSRGDQKRKKRTIKVLSG